MIFEVGQCQLLIWAKNCNILEHPQDILNLEKVSFNIVWNDFFAEMSREQAR
jgi:hypothetical protein